jgi:signal transduction histidine kinase/DNA-binding response OmpR family regulator
MHILAVRLQDEHDVVLARQRARQLAEFLAFDTQEQTRIATAVSEIARNALNYAGGGNVEFFLEGVQPPQVLLIRISDHGPGIAVLQQILNGQYASPTGLGRGILAAYRLMDQCDIQTSSRGTTVTLKKLLPRDTAAVTTRRLAQFADSLSHRTQQNLLEELRQRNQELLHTLEALRAKQEELVQLNRELEETNRGVVALYAELDERADHLRRADEMKSRFLSNMSHEFRVPINTILSLAYLLLERADGELTAEQDKQVTFIRKAAGDLAELVNDLLDLAKIEAGKITVRPSEFHVTTLFATLRGMLRPLLLNESIDLVFDTPVDLPLLFTDESKVSQILRNFISNALKFTERGDVNVSARLASTGDAIVFAVADTGIGIASADQETIFEEFTQLENALQSRIKGTGLGLPLCKKLATLLGGSIAVDSEVGVGSTFSVVIPVHYQPPEEQDGGVREVREPQGQQPVILVVEDEAASCYLYEQYLHGSGFQCIAVPTVRQARDLLRQGQPQLIFLDIMLPGEDAWTWLAELKNHAETRHIPVVVVTMQEEPRKALALGADAYCRKPFDRDWLLQTVQQFTRREPAETILIIDDDASSRYVLGRCLASTPYRIREAASGLEGLSMMHEERPRVVFLDVHLPDMNGLEVLERLQADAHTHDIPVIIYTAQDFDPQARHQLAARGVMILQKNTLTTDEVLAHLASVQRV